MNLKLSASEREDDNETTEMENLSVSQHKDKQKKKKNKKRRKTGPRSKMSSEDQENDIEDEREDEITRTVRLVDKMFGTSTFHQQRQETSTSSHRMEADLLLNVLSIQHKNLNPQTEIKRMFGKVVNQEQQKKRRGIGNVRSLRVVMISNPKDNWPPITRSGLSMNLVPAPEGEMSIAGNDKKKNLLYFSFDHSQR